MESSFKKNYERTVQSDGTIEIVHDQVRIPPSMGTAVMILMTIVLLPTSCAIGGAFHGYDARASNVPWTITTMIIYVILCFVVGRLLVKGKNHLLIKPNQGIVIHGKSLPFSDIQTIGTETLVNGNKKANSYAYAESHGNRIPFTKHVSQSLAEAIATEVKASSGYKWD